MQKHQKPLCWLLALSTIVLLVVLSLRVLHFYDPDKLLFDSEHVYLPIAQMLSEQGLQFFKSPRSIEVGMLSYLIPWLLHGNIVAIKILYIALFILAALMVIDLFRLLHKTGAALIMLLLLIAHKHVLEYIPQILTEPIIYFAQIFFFWSLIRVWKRPHAFYTFCLFLSMAISLLTRPTYIYLIELSAFCCVLYWIIAEMKRRLLPAVFTPIALSSLAAVFLIIIIQIKNMILFDYTGLQTGSGIALYYGLHPIYLGTEPVLHNALFDWFFLASQPGSHLLPTVDADIKQAALYQISHYHFSDWYVLILQKLKTIFFNPELETGVVKMAILRLMALFALLGLVLKRRDVFVWALALCVLYKGAAMFGVMLNTRYLYFEIDILCMFILSLATYELLRTLLRVLSQKQWKILLFHFTAPLLAIFLLIAISYTLLIQINYIPRLNPDYLIDKGSVSIKESTPKHFSLRGPEFDGGNYILSIDNRDNRPGCKYAQLTMIGPEGQFVYPLYLAHHQENIKLPFPSRFFYNDIQLIWQDMCDSANKVSFKQAKLYQEKTARIIREQLDKQQGIDHAHATLP